MANSTTLNAEQLRAQIKELRQQIIHLIAEMDHIHLQEIPAIQADYAVRIGSWETRLIEAELAYRRAKRKLTLVQMRLNRPNSQTLEEMDAELEEQLERELADWQERVDMALKELHEQIARQTSMVYLSKGETKRIKELYRILVKRLHPDLHLEDAEYFSELFQIAQSTYKNGQLDLLEALELSTRSLEQGDEQIENLDEQELGCALELIVIERDLMQEKLDELRLVYDKYCRNIF